VSFALPAVVLLLLALPGFIFFYAYKGSLRPQNDALISNVSMTMGWVLAFLGAIVAHAAWVPLANWCLSLVGSPLQTDVDSVAYLLAGEYKDGFQASAHSFTQHPYAVLIYFASLYTTAGGLGAWLHYLVRKFHWDTRIGFLRFNNQWHYLFSGIPDEPDIDGVLVTVTCKHRDHTCLYAGVLETYDFTSEGQLEKIVLISAARASLTADPSFSPIAGDKFIVWFKDINTLNIDYLHTKESDDTALRDTAIRPVPARGRP
jgi:hypothetical protein